MRDYLNEQLDRMLFRMNGISYISLESMDIDRSTTLVAAFARPLSFNCIPGSVSSSLLMRITYPGKIPELVKSCLSCIRELERQDTGTLEEWKWIYQAIQTVRIFLK